MAGQPLMEWVMSRDAAWRAYEIIRRYDVMANSFVRNAVYRVNTAALKRPVHGLSLIHILEIPEKFILPRRRR